MTTMHLKQWFQQFGFLKVKTSPFFLCFYYIYGFGTICLCSRKVGMLQVPTQELSTFLLSEVSVNLGGSPLLLTDLTLLHHKFFNIQVMMRSLRLTERHDQNMT